MVADVLVFVDAHVEMEPRWIEPLLQLIQTDNKTVAVPQAHSLHPETFATHIGSTDVYGSFTWELEYFWMQIPPAHAAASVVVAGIEPLLPQAGVLPLQQADHHGGVAVNQLQKGVARKTHH